MHNHFCQRIIFFGRKLITCCKMWTQSYVRERLLVRFSHGYWLRYLSLMHVGGLRPELYVVLRADPPPPLPRPRGTCTLQYCAGPGCK